MRNIFEVQKGFTQITASIAIIVCAAIIAGGWFSYAQFTKYQFRQAEKEKAAQALIAGQQRTLEETQRQIKELREETQKSSLVAQQAERAGQEAQETQRKYEEQNRQNTEADISAIVAKWQGSIALVHCFGGKFGAGQTSGSGVAFQFSDIPNPVVITNKHVLTDEWGYSMNNCLVSFFGYPRLYEDNSDIVFNPAEDFGRFVISSPDARMEEISYFPSVHYCIESPVLGDKILILGYPVTASVGTLVVTEGIISGFDGNYFITSAKVEHGNSGGAAIHVKNNCLLGLPTFAQVGYVESLARILDIRTVISF